MKQESERIRIEAWRRMGPEQKYNLFLNLMKTVRELKRSGVRAMHPGWTDKQVDEEVARIFLHART